MEKGNKKILALLPGIVAGISLVVCLVVMTQFSQLNATIGSLSDRLEQLEALELESLDTDELHELYGLVAELRERLDDNDVQLQALLDDWVPGGRAAVSLPVPSVETSVASAKEGTARVADPEPETPELEPEDGLVRAGDIIKVQVQADKLSDAYGYQFALYYDQTALAYKGGLKSAISPLSTIFQNEFDGYILVGATMLGKQSGYSSGETQVCELQFVVLQEGELPEITIKEVGVVDSNEVYAENLNGWHLIVDVQDA